MRLQISIRESGDITMVDVWGRSTTDGGSDSLGRKLSELVANGARKLLLNLADLTQIDSSGISVIIGTFVSLRNKGGELKLFGPCGSVLEVLRVLHLLEIIPCFDDESEALASFSPRGCAATI